MRRREAIRKHRKLWTRIGKEDLEKTQCIETNCIRNHCFLCEYASQFKDKEHKLMGINYVKNVCSSCPLEWPIPDLKNLRKMFPPCEDSLYGIWNSLSQERDKEERKILALIIANLKEKK